MSTLIKNAEEQLKNYVDRNLNVLLNLDDSEVEQIKVTELIDPQIIEFLKNSDPYFFYKNIAVYYVEESNEIWIEKF